MGPFSAARLRGVGWERPAGTPFDRRVMQRLHRRRVRLAVARLCGLCTFCMGHGAWDDDGFRVICGECFGYGDAEHQANTRETGSPWRSAKDAN